MKTDRKRGSSAILVSQILARADGDLRQVDVWLTDHNAKPEVLAIALTRSQHAQALIEVVEVHHCGSTGGFAPDQNRNQNWPLRARLDYLLARYDVKLDTEDRGYDDDDGPLDSSPKEVLLAALTAILDSSHAGGDKPRRIWLKKTLARLNYAAGVNRSSELSVDALRRVTDTLMNLDRRRTNMEEKRDQQAEDTRRELSAMICKQSPKADEFGAAYHTHGHPFSFPADAGLVEDLGLDSFDKIELAIAAEDAFGVEVVDDKIAAFTTFGDLADYLIGLRKI